MESPGQDAPRFNWNELVEQFQKQPMQSALIAFLVGLLLSLSPIRGLISFAVRLVLFVIKPALLILGGLKVYEYVAERSAGPEKTHK
ncbi:MAG TPA: hypothetical protein VE242_07670 [Chthoniobacterales bacterium]|nr:hypothetical protein [Chthoniobacterales bacterium]